MSIRSVVIRGCSARNTVCCDISPFDEQLHGWWTLMGTSVYVYNAQKFMQCSLFAEKPVKHVDEKVGAREGSYMSLMRPC